MRKTIAVSNIKDKINSFLLNSPDSEKDSRESMIKVIEEILMDTDNYHGFDYLTKVDMIESEFGISVGMQLKHNNEMDYDGFEYDPVKRFNNTDHTRVKYL